MLNKHETQYEIVFQIFCLHLLETINSVSLNTVLQIRLTDIQSVLPLEFSCLGKATDGKQNIVEKVVNHVT